MLTRITSIFLALITFLGAHVPAYAATAYLVSCTGTTSVTGKFIYVGIYDYMGAQVTVTFSEWCPATIEVQ